MFEQDVLDRLRSQNKSLSRSARHALYLCAFILMIIALAQPVIKEGEITVEAKSADILIGIDISDSMRAEDSYPNRLDFAKAKAIELIKRAPHNRIGVLAFAKHDYIVSPLSFDHSSVAFLLSKVRTDNITEKGTHLDSMLHSAINMLEHAKEKNLLLFTDGGDSEAFDKEIALAKENGLRLFIIGVGSEEGSPVRSSEGGFVKHRGDILISKLNPQIKELATETGGVYIEAVLGNADIEAMLHEIEEMAEKSTLKEEKIPQYTQLFYYPLALAAFFLLLAFSSFPHRAGKGVLLIALMFVGLDDVKAGLWDFQALENAKKAYEQEAYEKSASIYKDFSQDSSEAMYNHANSLYKSKAYAKALERYQNISSDDVQLQAKVLHNIGNSHVKLQQYEEALKAYEKALEIRQDQETEENYEALKKFLEQKQQQQKQDNQKEQENQKDQEKRPDQNKDSSSQKGKSDQQKRSEDKASDQEQKSPAKPDQQKNSKQQEEQRKEENKADASDQSQQDKTTDPKQKSLQQSEQEQPEQIEKEAPSVPVKMKKMSELEAKKWLKIIQKSQKGHLYKMQTSQHEEDENEKPW